MANYPIAMRRRTFLSGSACLVCGSKAGCLSLAPQSSGPDTHPFADRRITVRADSRSEGDHDVRAITAEAVEFWNEEGDQYFDFDVTLAMTDGDDPDVVITFADDSRDCEHIPNYSERVMGCAPILLPGSRPSKPVNSAVVAATRPRWSVLITTKHEIGHILGLGHEDDPLEIMSNVPADRIPLYQHRRDMWAAVREGSATAGTASSLYSHAVGQWIENEFANAAPAFGAAREEFVTATMTFDEAAELLVDFEGHVAEQTVDLDHLRSLFDRLSGRTAAGREFSAAMEDAANAMVAGDTETATARVETANTHINEFNAIPQVPLRDVAIALGLVRGFDREDPAVEVDDEEL